MDKNQGYEAGPNGAICSDCGALIEPGEPAVLLMPAEVQGNGTVNPTAEAIHGVLHEGCYERL